MMGRVVFITGGLAQLKFRCLSFFLREKQSKTAVGSKQYHLPKQSATKGLSKMFHNKRAIQNQMTMRYHFTH